MCRDFVAFIVEICLQGPLVVMTLESTLQHITRKISRTSVLNAPRHLPSKVTYLHIFEHTLGSDHINVRTVGENSDKVVTCKTTRGESTVGRSH